jgi:hypothetical protein
MNDRDNSSSAAAEGNTVTLKKLIVEISDLIQSSKHMLAGLDARDVAAGHSRPETSPLPASTSLEPAQDGRAGEDRRQHEELSPDIIALIASCGERVRKSDGVVPETDAPNWRKAATAG